MPQIKTREDFETQLASAISQTREALDATDRGEEMPGVSAQYETLLEYLEKVRDDVQAGTVPPENDRHSQSVGGILVDGWDPSDPLGALILQVDSYYLTRF